MSENPYEIQLRINGIRQKLKDDINRVQDINVWLADIEQAMKTGNDYEKVSQEFKNIKSDLLLISKTLGYIYSDVMELAAKSQNKE